MPTFTVWATCEAVAYCEIEADTAEQAVALSAKKAEKDWKYAVGEVGHSFSVTEKATGAEHRMREDKLVLHQEAYRKVDDEEQG